MSLSCTVFEILTLICQKFKTSRDLNHAHLGDSWSFKVSILCSKRWCAQALKKFAKRRHESCRYSIPCETVRLFLAFCATCKYWPACSFVLLRMVGLRSECEPIKTCIFITQNKKEQKRFHARSSITTLVIKEGIWLSVSGPPVRTPWWSFSSYY